MKTECF